MFCMGRCWRGRVCLCRTQGRYGPQPESLAANNVDKLVCSCDAKGGSWRLAFRLSSACSLAVARCTASGGERSTITALNSRALRASVCGGGVARRMGNRSIRVVGSNVPHSHVRPACRNLPARVETRPVQRLNNYGHFTERTERTENLHQRPEGRPGGAEG